MRSTELICDGCGQPASQEHITRRLKRLENMTRYRPVHVQALFLGAVSPEADADHLYSAEQEFRGEGADLLHALEIDASRGAEATLVDFQRRGFLLAYVLECPSETIAKLNESLEKRLGATMARVRRSHKPRKIFPFGAELDPFIPRFASEDLGGELVLPEPGRAFRLNELRHTRSVTTATATGASPL